MEDKVLTHIDHRGVATVTLNNPERHNAFDDGIIAQLTHAFETIATDDSIRLMVLASTGKSFSAGADLGWMKRMASYSYGENLRDANGLAQMLKTLNFMPQVTIARVQGAAYGGAVGLVSCCDMAVAGSSASFCLSEVRIGLIPATISPYVIAAMGQRAARRYFTSAERFDATVAARLGLISEVVEDADLDSCLEDLIATLLGNSPAGIRAAKKLVLDMANQPIDDELIAESSARIAAQRVSAEGQEGLKAFLEKRKPNWIHNP